MMAQRITTAETDMPIKPSTETDLPKTAGRIGYKAVADYICSVPGTRVSREDLMKVFPGTPARGLAKALEMASEKGLIECIDRGVYAAGTKEQIESAYMDEPRPEPVRIGNIVRYITVASPEAVDTPSLIASARSRMSAIEKAWFSVAGTAGGCASAYAS